MSDNLTTHNRLAAILKRVERLEKELAKVKENSILAVNAINQLREMWLRKYGS